MDEELQEKFDEVKDLITPTSVSRWIVRSVASIGAGFVATKLVKTYVPTDNKKQELQVAVGAYVIGGMAEDAAAEWTAKQFNEYLDFVKGIISSVKSKTSTEETTPEDIPTE